MAQISITRSGLWMDAILDRVQTDWIDLNAEWSMICLLTCAVGFPAILDAGNDNGHHAAQAAAPPARP